jgi:hypothetical protein
MIASPFVGCEVVAMVAMAETFSLPYHVFTNSCSAGNDIPY